MPSRHGQPRFLLHWFESGWRCQLFLLGSERLARAEPGGFTSADALAARRIFDALRPRRIYLLWSSSGLRQSRAAMRILESCSGGVEVQRDGDHAKRPKQNAHAIASARVGKRFHGELRYADLVIARSAAH